VAFYYGIDNFGALKPPLVDDILLDFGASLRPKSGLDYYAIFGTVQHVLLIACKTGIDVAT